MSLMFRVLRQLSLFTFALVLLIWPSANHHLAKENEAGGWFSHQAVGVSLENATTTQIRSPDGEKFVHGRYDTDFAHITLNVLFKGKSFQAKVGPGTNPEVLWAPDSKAFAVTSSEQGANGWFDTQIYYVSEEGLKKVDPTEKVIRAFGHPVACDYPEAPNVATITWLVGSQRILLAAQIMHHSVCDSMGTFKVYEVALPDVSIIKVYDQIQAKRLFWNDLGEELRRADDECIRHPKSCWVPFHHQRIEQPQFGIIP